MSLTLWRISQYPGLTGIGGLYGDGRWHTKGRQIIYTSDHPALALVETMAHLDLSLDEVPDALKLCRIEVDHRLGIHQRTLPVGWQVNEVMSRKVGDAWLAAREHPLFAVPSAVLPHATNYLVNPAHPDVAGKVVEVSVEDVWIDRRFIR